MQGWKSIWPWSEELDIWQKYGRYLCRIQKDKGQRKEFTAGQAVLW